MAYCVNNQTNTEYNLSIEQTDKYIMFSPDDWGLILIYIRLLEQHTRNKSNQIINTEINKFLDASDTLLY
jgi:hypothetical protein